MAAAAAFAGAAMASVVVAQNAADDGVIESTNPAALPAPDEWSCDVIRPDYVRFLEDGNAPESWRYAGTTYRDVDDDALYTWADWLAWEEEAGCAALLAGRTGGLTTGHAAVGAAVAGLGAALLVSGNGANAKSPG